MRRGAQTSLTYEDVKMTEDEMRGDIKIIWTAMWVVVSRIAKRDVVDDLLSSQAPVHELVRNFGLYSLSRGYLTSYSHSRMVEAEEICMAGADSRLYYSRASSSHAKLAGPSC